MDMALWLVKARMDVSECRSRMWECEAGDAMVQLRLCY